MKHRFFTLLFAVLAGIGMMQGEIYSGTCGENLTWVFDSSTQTLTISGTGAMSDYNGSSQPWYSLRNDIKNVIIDNGVTTIGKYAFYYIDITSISLPQTLTTIEYCGLTKTKLTSLIFPSSLQRLDGYAVAYSSQLSSIAFEGMTPPTLGGSAFESLKLGTKIKVPCGYANAYRNAQGWSGLYAAIYSDCESTCYNGTCGENLAWVFDSSTQTLTISGTGTMSDYNGSSQPWYSLRNDIKNVIIDNGVTTIGKYAFYYIDITSISLPQTLTTIEYCGLTKTKLTSLIFPSSLQRLDGYAVAYSSQLSSIAFEGMTPPTLGGSAFENLKSGTKIYVPCGYANAYKNAQGWSGLYAIIEEDCNGVIIPQYNIIVTSEDVNKGSVIGTGKYQKGTSVVISASAHEGYLFSKWSDGNTENPRTIVLTQDTILTAEFNPCEPIYKSVTHNICGESAFKWKGQWLWGTSQNDTLTSENFSRISVCGKDTLLRDTLKATNACDSIIECLFHFNPRYEVHVYDTVIEGTILIGNLGTSYPYYLTATVGEMYYNDTLRTFSDCDSIVFHTVTVLPVPRYTISLSVNNSEYGSVEGAGTYKQDTTITITATPNEGYQFNEWSDGSIANPRTIKVTGDSSFTAIFAPQECVIASGTCGTNLKWQLSCDSVLTISGTGAMTSWSDQTKVPWYAYRGDIKSAIIQEGVTSIGGIAFEKCKSLTFVQLPNSLKTLSVAAFENCSALPSIIIPDSVTSWGNYVFFGCQNLETVYVGKSLNGMSVDGPFTYCYKLQSIDVSPENPYYCSINGVVFSKDTTVLVEYPRGRTSDTYVIPEGVKTIGKGAFETCRTIVHLTMPEGLTTINTYGLRDCPGIQELFFPSTMKTLANNAIYFLVTSGNIKTITCAALTPPSVGTSGLNANNNIPVYVPAESIDLYKTANRWKDFTNIKAIGSNPTVTFRDWDGTVLKIDTVQVGGTATPPMEIPEHEGSHFVGWDKDYSNVQYDIIVTAMFETNQYLVQFVDWDGTVLKSDSVWYQGWVEAPDSPYRKGYVFTGWDKEFTWEYLIGDMTITAQYMQLQPGDAFVREDGGVHALFSVAEGKQVLFSRGNLQFNAAQGSHACADGTTQPGTWRFAPEQYNVRTWENYSRSAEYDGWIDLFYYGTSGYNGIMPYKDTIDAETLGQIGNVTGTNYDFGIYNAISNGGNTPGEWRLFTMREWQYLIKERPHAYKLHNIVKINDVYGVVILPDNSDTTLLRQEINPEEYYYPYYAPSYSLNEWRQLEAKGAIFIPAGGEGRKYNGYFNVYAQNEQGYYMASYTPSSTFRSMQAVGFDTTMVWTGLTMSISAISVRLVKDVDIFHLNAIPNHSTWGAILGDSLYFGEDISVTAVPNYGYHFVQWSDGNTDNPRTFTLTSDSTIVAEFAPEIHTMNITCDAEQGNIVGESGEFGYMTEQIIEAVANYGYTFSQWSDGVTDNPRTVVITQDTTITAIFTINHYPVVLLDYDGKLLSKQSVAYNHAAEAPEVPVREGYTFAGWTTDIEHIIDTTYAIAIYDKIGGTLTYLSEEGDVIATENVDLHLPEAPSIAGKSFKGWLTESADSENGIVLRATYTSDNPTTSEDVTVTPSSNSADVSFPFITGALTYELVIRDLSGNVVCKIMFNSFGQLLGIAFAPSRNRNQQATQSTGFNFTVEGLNASTTYSYEFVAYDDTDDAIETLSGSFTTTADTPTNIDNASAANAPQKYIQDGHLLIDNNNRTFDARGQQMR